MAEMPEIPGIAEGEDLHRPCQPASEEVVRHSPVASFLSYLVFEGHGVRIGLEISLCVVFYSLVFALLPWNLIGIPPRWSGLVAWFSCCSLVVMFDQLFLCRSASALRKSYLLYLGGAFEQALQILEQIGPRSRSLVPLPTHLYHLHRAEVFAQARSFSKAEWELVLAERIHADRARVAILRCLIHRLKGEFSAAAQELEAAQQTSGSSAVLCFEAALLSFESAENPWEAKRLFQRTMEMPEMPHYAGETTHQLAKAYWNACRLKTGEAEQGLEELGWSIERLRSNVFYVDTIRPFLAQLLLERSAYYAGHGDPAAAILDLKTALLYCAYPQILDKAEAIKDDLEWRYKMPLVW